MFIISLIVAQTIVPIVYVHVCYFWNVSHDQHSYMDSNYCMYRLCTVCRLTMPTTKSQALKAVDDEDALTTQWHTNVRTYVIIMPCVADL